MMSLLLSLIKLHMLNHEPFLLPWCLTTCSKLNIKILG